MYCRRPETRLSCSDVLVELENCKVKLSKLDLYEKFSDHIKTIQQNGSEYYLLTYVIHQLESVGIGLVKP